MAGSLAEHHASVTVNAPAHQVYSLFSHFNDFPKFMSFVKEVTYYDDQTSHWVADVVGHHEWDAVNQDWIEDRQLGWRSTNGMENQGKVTFQQIGPNQTQVDVYVGYNPPAGFLGDIGESLGGGQTFESKLQHDLDNFVKMVDQAPPGALDPTSSNYLFQSDSVASKGTTTSRQEATMGQNYTANQPTTDQGYTTTDQYATSQGYMTDQTTASQGSITTDQYATNQGYRTDQYATGTTIPDNRQVDTDVDTEEGRRLKLREEQLQVDKQPMQTGEVGIRKEVVTEQKTINVPVTHEEVYVERRPASGQVSDTAIGEGETFRVPVREEQVNVSKQTVETGEVVIGKRQVQDTQRVSDTVKREEAHLEREGDVDIQGNPGDLQS